MFGGEITFYGIIIMFIGVGLMIVTQKMGWARLNLIVLWIGLLASLYCLTVGIFLYFNWHNPLANIDPSEIGRISSKARGRGGIILLAIRFWPFVLIGLGGYFAYHYFRNIWFSLEARKNA